MPWNTVTLSLKAACTALVDPATLMAGCALQAGSHRLATPHNKGPRVQLTQVGGAGFLIDIEDC